MSLMRTCEEVSALLIAREDRDLRLSEKAVLRMHLVVCRACPNFERQLLIMRNALRQWRTQVDGDVDDAAIDGAAPRSGPRP